MIAVYLFALVGGIFSALMICILVIEIIDWFKDIQEMKSNLMSLRILHKGNEECIKLLSEELFKLKHEVEGIV